MSDSTPPVDQKGQQRDEECPSTEELAQRVEAMGAAIHQHLRKGERERSADGGHPHLTLAQLPQDGRERTQ